MKILLDTHAVIWVLTGDRRLGHDITEAILDMGNSVYFSVVSLWEIAIKHAKSPARCPYDEQEVYEQCLASGLEILDLTPEHIFSLRTLKVKDGCTLSNMDPFDRILISQAKSEEMRFVSTDYNLKNYDEKCIMEI